MKQQSGIIIAFLSLALLASLMANFYYYDKAAEMEDRIQLYLPQANKIQMENYELRQSLEYQEFLKQRQLSDTMITNTTYYGKDTATPATPPIEYQLPPAQQNPPTNNDFRDLNKQN